MTLLQKHATWPHPPTKMHEMIVEDTPMEALKDNFCQWWATWACFHGLGGCLLFARDWLVSNLSPEAAIGEHFWASTDWSCSLPKNASVVENIDGHIVWKDGEMKVFCADWVVVLCVSGDGFVSNLLTE